MISLEDDGNCFVCGESNPEGLKIKFKQTEKGVTARFSVDVKYQGYKGIVHGGIIAAILDEASVKSVVVRGIKAVTAEIVLRFKKPLYVNETAIIHSTIVKTHGKLFEVDAIIQNSNGAVVARSRAKVLRRGG